MKNETTVSTATNERTTYQTPGLATNLQQTHSILYGLLTPMTGDSHHGGGVTKTPVVPTGRSRRKVLKFCNPRILYNTYFLQKLLHEFGI